MCLEQASHEMQHKTCSSAVGMEGTVRELTP